MKSSSKLAFTSLLFICLGTSLDANPIPKSSCVELSPDAQEFVSFVTNQMIVGTSAYLVAHLERFRGSHKRTAYVGGALEGLSLIQDVHRQPASSYG